MTRRDATGENFKLSCNTCKGYKRYPNCCSVTVTVPSANRFYLAPHKPPIEATDPYAKLPSMGIEPTGAQVHEIKRYESLWRSTINKCMETSISKAVDRISR
ncbi:uncharacterized protein LOC110677819 [Aedes aegypti]|uniref:Uncharacterized protein n=1 Tax=Aedes aegypti TaxID=7159 RepID=A0A6I8TZ64_AEDAE|nr:uncharacterized protein LOC110674881 [Aedes aegypti]XP_021705067.1 uncharacterized protein LOC110677819 [Aedes aegypti]